MPTIVSAPPHPAHPYQLPEESSGSGTEGACLAGRREHIRSGAARHAPVGWAGQLQQLFDHESRGDSRWLRSNPTTHYGSIDLPALHVGACDLRIAHQAVHRNRQHPAAIVLPVILRRREQQE
jgi:hypothetical protein